MLKDFEGLFVTFIYSNYFMSLPDGSLSEDLKTAEIVPVYKEKERTDKNYYLPASILSNISKNCERSICSQMYDYFEFPRNTNVNLGKDTAFGTASFI